MMKTVTPKAVWLAIRSTVASMKAARNNGDTKKALALADKCNALWNLYYNVKHNGHTYVWLPDGSYIRVFRNT